jgi:hypothetical protein
MGELTQDDRDLLRRTDTEEAENPVLKAALERARSLSEACHFDEAIKVVDGLIKEVGESRLASRFGEEREIMKQGVVNRIGAVPNPNLYSNMSEADHKRGELKIMLTELRAQLITNADRFRNIILDFEASKREF